MEQRSPRLAPEFWLYGIADVERVFGVACFGEAQVVERFGLGAKHHFHFGASVFMFAVGAPCADDCVCFGGGAKDCRVIFGACWIGLGAHDFGVGSAVGEDVGHGKRDKAKGAGAAFAAFHGWVVLHFGRFGRV